MPFDGLPEGVVSDMVKLRIALDGVCRRWSNTSIGAREIGGRPDAPHCTLGWLLVATEWDRDETTRLALEYVYPALPATARKADSRMRAISNYNDRGSRKRVVQLLTDALQLAEQRAVC